MGKFPSSRAKELDKACFRGTSKDCAELVGIPIGSRYGWIHSDVRLRYILGNTVGETIPTLLDQDQRAHLLLTLDNPNADTGKSDPCVVAYYQGILLEILRQLGLRFTLQLVGRTMSYAIRLRRKGLPLTHAT